MKLETFLEFLESIVNHVGGILKVVIEGLIVRIKGMLGITTTTSTVTEPTPTTTTTLPSGGGTEPQTIRDDIRPKAKVWQTEVGFKIVGLLSTNHGQFITHYRTADRNDHGTESVIHLDGNEIYRGSQETIGQPFEANEVVYFPNEHGSHVLKYENAVVQNASVADGRWSVRGTVFNGEPTVFYNNRYSNREFDDHPILINVETGQKYFTFTTVKAMPRCHVYDGSKHYVTVNFGNNGSRGLTINGGGLIASDSLQVALHRGYLYVGGGAKRSQTGKESDRNGKIYIYHENRFDDIFDTGCSLINLMLNHGGNLYVIGDFPHRAFRIEPDGRVYQIFDGGNNTYPSKGGGSFSGSIAVHQDDIYVAMSGGSGERKRGEVFQLN